MFSTKQLYLFCTHSAFRRFCAIHTRINSDIKREFSSKNFKNGNKPTNKIKVEAKNDFVTHQLNTSISGHLKRQQKIWNRVHEEEKKLYYQSSDSMTKSQNNTKRFDYFEGTNYNRKNTNDQPRSVNNKYRDRTNQEKCQHERVSFGKRNLDEDENENEESDIDSDDYDREPLEVPNWEDMSLVKINKEFYFPSPTTQNRSVQEIEDFQTKKQIKIVCVASNVDLLPIFGFDELNNLAPKIIDTVKRQAFMQCTPIQSQGIPMALSGADMIAISQPRTGKMLAMILSALIHISHQMPSGNANEQGPIAVILALTPEMSDQIHQTANQFCNDKNIRCTVLCNSPNKSKSYVKQNEVGDLLITTPFHLYEYLHSKVLSLERCSQLSLYEADKLMEMGFDEEMVQIESQIRPECQRLLWSSVWTSDLLKVALSNSIRLEVGSSTVKADLAQNIKQIIKISTEKEKESTLKEIITSIKTQNGSQKTLIFTETPEKANRISNILRKWKLHSNSLHNKKSAKQRDVIFSEFENGQMMDYLVLTDLAAKNLHFSQISNVINFDMPYCITEYVHRVNRTGRSGDETSVSYSIVTEDDGDLADDLITILQKSNQSVDPALMILKAANADSDDEISFAIPRGKSFQKYTIDNSQK